MLGWRQRLWSAGDCGAYREYGVPIERIIACGGISQKSPMTMQIYADVLGCPMEVSADEQSCALGAAMAGAVVGGIHANFTAAASAMTGKIKAVISRFQKTNGFMIGC